MHKWVEQETDVFVSLKSINKFKKSNNIKKFHDHLESQNMTLFGNSRIYANIMN